MKSKMNTKTKDNNLFFFKLQLSTFFLYIAIQKTKTMIDM